MRYFLLPLMIWATVFAAVAAEPQVSAGAGGDSERAAAERAAAERAAAERAAAERAAAERAAAERAAAERAAAERAAAERAAAERLAAEKAAAERAVTAAVTGHRQALLCADLQKMLTFCDKSYRELDGNGQSRTYADLVKLAGYFHLMRTSDDLEVVMENALLLQDSVMSDFQRQQIRSLKNTPEARTILTTIRTNYGQIADRGRELAAHIRVSGVRINGDRAVAVLLLTDPVSCNTYRTDYQLVKKNNKWLVVKSEAKGVVKP